MTHDNAQLTRLANALRIELQDKTCCPLAAVGVLKVALASFVLDVAGHDPNAAADLMDDIARKMAEHIRSGAVSICRAKQGSPHGRAH